MTFALAIPPLTVKNWPVRLFGCVRLIRRMRYVLLSEQYLGYGASFMILIFNSLSLVYNLWCSTLYLMYVR